MNYARCKCGKIESWGSYGSYADCDGCKDCKTTLSTHPDHHKELKEHDYDIRYNQQTGKPYKVCKKCQKIDEESYKDSQ